VGLTGNLRDFQFTNNNGSTVTGAQVNYNGQPTGYTAGPVESINYASVHDNQTLFDAVQIKSSPADSLEDRVRRHNVAMSVIALGQGIPFFLAGDELLRSKSLDQNSFNSGDWFNKLDFTFQSDNWGVGLPLQSQNGSDWAIEQPLLADTVIRPGHEQIAMSKAWFEDLMRIRYSSRLFRMRTASEIQAGLHFLNTGPTQQPGIIVMKLDCSLDCDDEPYRHAVVIFNATKQTQSFQHDSLKHLDLQLHPVLRRAHDPVVKGAVASQDGTLTVPALSTVVFVTSKR
jgi:pullulanase